MDDKVKAQVEEDILRQLEEEEKQRVIIDYEIRYTEEEIQRKLKETRSKLGEEKIRFAILVAKTEAEKAVSFVDMLVSVLQMEDSIEGNDHMKASISIGFLFIDNIVRVTTCMRYLYFDSLSDKSGLFARWKRKRRAKKVIKETREWLKETVETMLPLELSPFTPPPTRKKAAARELVDDIKRMLTDGAKEDEIFALLTEKEEAED